MIIIIPVLIVNPLAFTKAVPVFGLGAFASQNPQLQSDQKVCSAVGIPVGEYTSSPHAGGRLVLLQVAAKVQVYL